jgi:hypothetical protein
MKSLDVYTYEELGKAMARVLACAGEELLNDAEVHRFWEVHDEIQRRSAPYQRSETWCMRELERRRAESNDR